jgi:hypothetical protein
MGTSVRMSCAIPRDGGLSNQKQAACQQREVLLQLDCGTSVRELSAATALS